MNKEFVTYEQALILKELGFDEPCIGFFENNGKNSLLVTDSVNFTNTDLKVEGVSSPLYQQAFRWFRETYNMDVDIIRDSEVHYQDETRWIVKVSDWNNIRVKDFPIAQLKFPNTSHHTDFKSYDKALEKGLEEALKFIQNERI